jgi:hypothetical protein
MNETTSDTRNLDTSIAPVPAVLRRRITDAIDAIKTTTELLDQAALAMVDIVASREDGQETTSAELDAVAEPLRGARLHAAFLRDTVLFELDEQVGHAHAPDDLAERAKEIDELLGSTSRASSEGRRAHRSGHKGRERVLSRSAADHGDNAAALDRRRRRCHVSAHNLRDVAVEIDESAGNLGRSLDKALLELDDV